jgi:uncharacterized membrane protein
MKELGQMLLILIIVLAMDAVWLTTTAPTSRALIAGIQGSPLAIRWVPAAMVYIIIVAAVWFFAVRPASGWIEAAALGGALGFAMYGLYDLTNYSTLKGYTARFAVTDIVWGTVLCGVAAGATYAIGQ